MIKYLGKLLLALMLCTVPAFATSYTVKAGGGGSFTTISACAGTAVAGDTCTVFVGSYAGWTQGTNGSAGNPITFIKNSGDTVNITSGITISSRSYITISGFSSIAGGITGNNATAHNILTLNVFNGCEAAFRINDGAGGTGSDNVFSFNTVNSQTGNCVGLYLYGDRNLIDHNAFIGTDGDCMDLGGTNVVIRDNTCTGLDGSVSGQHIDFIQVIGGGTTPTLAFSLVEGNTEQGCANDGNNCHFIIIRTGGPTADTVLVRFNYVQNIDGSGGNYGGVGDNAPNGWFYNNTIATEALLAENGDCVSYQNAANGVALNNLCYNTTGNGWSPTTGNSIGNGNIAYNSGYSGGWNSPYSSEATYASLHNANPLFSNYPTSGTLTAGSPAIGTGVALTTASGSGSGTSLTVVNAHGLQPGWAGTQGDQIRIGASTTAQISAINYSTNVLTLTGSVSWSNGDPIYLYKDSSGTTQLLGALPTVGAFQAAISGPSATFSPTTVTFSNTIVGHPSSPTVVTLTNVGTSTMTISSFSITGTNAGDFSQTHTCGGTLAASASCTISVTFTPTTTGTRTANISVADNAPGSPQLVPLSGTGIPAGPIASFSPTSVSFPNTLVGNSSSPVTVTLTNTGTSVMNISSFSITGTNAGDFSQTHTCGATLGVSVACTISVTFTPTTTGARTANVSVIDDAPGTPQTVTISGTGTAAGPAVSFSPTSVSFPTTLVSSSSSPVVVTLTNTGTASLTLSSFSITGTNAGDFSQTHTCGGTLAASASCTISATFSPTTTGTRTANVSVADSATGSPHLVPLSGLGANPGPIASFSPTSVSFPTTTVSSSSSAIVVTVTNTGTSLMTFSSFSITGTNAGDFSQTHTCGGTLAASASCTISVTFTPTTTGTRTANVSVADDAPGSAQLVPLSGIGGTVVTTGPSAMRPGLIYLP